MKAFVLFSALLFGIGFLFALGGLTGIALANGGLNIALKGTSILVVSAFYFYLIYIGSPEEI